MKAIAPLVLVAIVGCAHRADNPPPDDAYTQRTSASTTVTTHPPPPSVVSTTRTTSAELVTERNPSTGPIVAANRPSARAGTSDRHLSDRIRTALRGDQTLRDVQFDRVRIETSEGHVVLTGLLSTVADKVAIEQRIREVRGVVAVDNRIEILR